MSLQLIPGMKSMMPSLRGQPVVAIDLGMSTTKKTTGFAMLDPRRPAKFENCCVTYGDAIGRICKLLSGSNAPDVATLILEAPLSVAFSAQINPTAREELESDPPRPWHHQPAAGLGLLAVIFLRKLLSTCESGKASLHVFEGFLTGDFELNGRNRTHRRDAHSLARAFQNEGHVLLEAPDNAESLLSLVAPNIDSIPPAVLRVTEDAYQFI